MNEQILWMNDYLDRGGDYLFIVERKDGTPEGIVGLYDVRDGEAEWGRWVLHTGSMAAAESVLNIYRVAFDTLVLERVYCRTVAENAQVVSFHDSSGLRRTNQPVPDARIDSRRLPMIEHELTADHWPGVRLVLERQALRIASRLR